jgi:hypothetical protein
MRIPEVLVRRALAACVIASLAPSCGGEPSDEELIEQLVESITGKVEPGYADRVIGHTDVARYALDVRVPHHAGVYDENTVPEVFSAFKRSVRERFEGDNLRLRGLKIDLAGDRAEVAFSAVSGVGLLRVGMTVRKPEPRVWKITRVHIDR